MSRIAKKPLEIPKDVTVQINDGKLKVSGQAGSLELVLRPEVSVRMEQVEGKNFANFSVANPEDKKQKAFWGLFYRLVSNMIRGVREPFKRELELVGIGYKAAMSGNKLILELGFSHSIDFTLPAGVGAKVEKNIITLTGIDKQLVGNTAAQIRSLRKPEPYKGKGVRYVGEVVRKKAGKAAVKTA